MGRRRTRKGEPAPPGGHVLVRASADADLLTIADHLAEISLERSERFQSAVARTCALAAGMPGIGAPAELKGRQWADVRVIGVTRFASYLVYYRPIEGGIEVLRVLHGSRDLPEILETGET